MSKTAEHTLGREAIAGLLARAPSEELLSIAERFLSEVDVEMAGPARLGTVQLQVREPVEGLRFNLADVLVTEATVSAGGFLGWGIRMGRDPVAAVGAAVCDLIVEVGHPTHDDVFVLCQSTQALLAGDREQEWDEVAPTIVRFEELDG